MNAIQNFKNRFTLLFVLAAGTLSAQNQIQSTETDEKFGNTTVVYTKDSNYQDQAILAQLDNSYGVGDVVRIAIAEPKPAASEMFASDDPAVAFAAAAKPAPKTTPKVVMVAPKKVEVLETPAPAPVAAPKKVAAPVTTNIGGKMVKKGSIFRLEKVYFDTDKYAIKAESEAELTRLFEFLNDNPGVVIEVRGHTNNLMWPNVDFANELSTNRAKEVADWLIAKGIAANRIQSKGFGWTMPVEPNINAEGRKKNQRVEIKILSM